MKIHRFYITETKLEHDFWFSEQTLIHQWLKVLRFRIGQQLVLFNDNEDKLYKIIEIEKDSIHLEYITDFNRVLPKKNIYLFWSLLKKDKNDWVIQKGTELGVSHFIPLIADRSEKTGFNINRAEKIAIEAAEQCGRSDIPKIRDAMHVVKAIEQYKDKVVMVVCEQGSEDYKINETKLGILVGPEGGWSEKEKLLFKDNGLKHLGLNDFTLRAETAVITGVIKLLQ